MKVILIGGTSHVGKSTMAKELAQTLGWNDLSTDRLARHPGRPWRIGETDLPKDVVSHYQQLSAVELLGSVLTHYRQNVWPIVDAIVRSHSNNPFDPCLVFEGSAILPELVAASAFEDATAVWLTASEDLIAHRIRESSHYSERTGAEKQLIDAFVKRSLAFNEFTLNQVKRFGLQCLDASVQDTMDKLTAQCRSDVS